MSLRRRAAYRLCAARKYEVKPRTCLLFNFLNGCLPFYGWVRSDHVSLTWFVQVMEVARQPHQFSTRQPICYRSTVIDGPIDRLEDDVLCHARGSDPPRLLAQGR